MPFDLTLITLLIAAGIFAGLLAGLFGIGGGLVIVPALFFLLQSLDVPPEVAMSMAVSTSLVSIIPTAISSLRAHHRLGNVDWSIVKRWALPTVCGVLVGASMVALLRTPLFVLFFGILLLFVALTKLWPRKAAAAPAMPVHWVQAVVALVIGWASAIAGVGGGATGVPALTAMGVPIHRAVGTCAALGLFIAAPASLWLLLLAETPALAPAGTLRFVYLPALILLTPATVLCAPMGAKLGKRLAPQLLNYGFAALLIVVGLRMVWSIF